MAKKLPLDEATVKVVRQVLAMPPKPHESMKVGRPRRKKRGTKGRASSSKP